MTLRGYWLDLIPLILRTISEIVEKRINAHRMIITISEDNMLKMPLKLASEILYLFDKKIIYTQSSLFANIFRPLTHLVPDCRDSNGLLGSQVF
jgi:hypothetical protein